jgi:Arf-GAP/coiled-coil/ANK repeat/PH domain-containing protein
LQAENEEEMNSWIEIIQKSIGAALHSDSPPSALGVNKGDKKEHINREELSSEAKRSLREVDSQRKVLVQIRAVAGNSNCCDCGADEPEWAAINFGNVLCIECSGIHRSLGVHVSKVRSLILDKWEPEIVAMMLRLGNRNVNAILERVLTVPKISDTADRPSRVKYITAKYVSKDFVSRDYILASINNSATSSSVSPNSLHEAFWETVVQGDLPRSLSFLMAGAAIDWRNPSYLFRPALLQSIVRRNDISAEFLLQWQCDPNLQDQDGWTAMHHCAEVNNPRLTARLLRRNVPIGVQDQKKRVCEFFLI